MPQSLILETGSNFIRESFLLKWILSKVDPKEELKYQSVITSFAKKPISIPDYLIDYFSNLTYFSKLTSKIDFKSVIIFLFIVTTIIFPGYGTEDSGTSFLSGSPSGSIGNHIGFISNLAISLLSFGMIMAVFVSDVSKNNSVLKFSRFDILFLLFITALSASSFFSIYPSISFIWLLKVYRGVLVYFIFSRITLNQKYLRIICFAFLVVVLFESVLVLIQYLHQGLLGIPIETASNASTSQVLYALFNGTTFFRPPGTTEGANGLAFILAFSLPFTLIFIFDKKIFTKCLGIFALSLSGTALITTLSRWGIITFFFSLGIFIFLIYTSSLQRFKSRLLIRIAFIFIFFALTFFLIQPYLLSRFFDVSVNDGSLAVRVQLIIQAIYVFTHNPLLGIGGDTFPNYLVNYDFTPLKISQAFPAPVHNFYLLILSETGIISFFLFITLSIYVAISFVKNKTKIYSTNNYFMSLVVIAVFSAFLTFLFNGSWEILGLGKHLTTVLFFLVLGLYFNIVRNASEIST